ncbi:hypothetical protein Tco_1338851 [Tanacetum coccineum]
MDDPNITMEEYIRLEEEKARRHGHTFNWQTATFEKVKNYEDEDDHPIDFETEFPAIVFDNTLTAIQSEPTIWHHYQLLIRGTMIRYHNKGSTLQGIRHNYEQRRSDYMEQTWPLVREFILEFLSTCRMSDTIMYIASLIPVFPVGGLEEDALRSSFILSFKGNTRAGDGKAGFGAMETSWAPPLLMFCNETCESAIHRMIAYSISGRGQTPEKVTGIDLFYLRNMDRGTINIPHPLAQYLFRHVEGRKSGAKLSGGHFIGCLAMHFGLVSDDGLIYMSLGGSTSARVEEAASEISALAPTHAPPPPLPASQPHTMSQRIERLEEEVHDLRRDVLMDASGQTYQPFDSTLVGSSGLSFWRRVKTRTGDASTSVAIIPILHPTPDLYYVILLLVICNLNEQYGVNLRTMQKLDKCICRKKTCGVELNPGPFRSPITIPFCSRPS